LGLFLLYNPTIFCQTFAFDSKVVADPHLAGDHLGHYGGNAIFGDYMVAGAHFADHIAGGVTTLRTGAVYLYHWNDTACVWDQIDVIYAESAVGVLDIQTDSEFGAAVALENDLIAIGASQYDNYDIYQSGIVYIYRIIADEAVFVERLNPLRNDLTVDSELTAKFGFSLKMHGGRLIAAAPFEDEDDALVSVVNSGAAYIYEWNNLTSEFDFQNKITATIRHIGDQFGNEVSVFGNHAAVAARFEDRDEADGDIKNGSGSVYIFRKNVVTGVWSQTQKLVAFDRTELDYFGSSVDMSQENIVVGAYTEDPVVGGVELTNSGSAYIYLWNDATSTFDFQQKIFPSDNVRYDFFGTLVAIDNYQILVGSPGHDFDEAGLDSLFDAGAAYLFAYSGGIWSQAQKFVGFDRNSIDHFGEALSINNNRLMIGAYGQDYDELGGGTFRSAAGAVYLYVAENKPIINDITVVQEGLCTGVADLYVSGVLYDAYEWEWHEGSCDGPVVGTGETIEVNPTETTTYCVRALGCFNYVEEVDCECVEVEAKTGNWHQKTTDGLYETGNAIATDSEGNVYITGIYQGYAVFDGGDNANVTVDADPAFTTNTKSYVAKYDNCANLMWVAYATGNGADDYSYDMAIRESGDYLFIVGEFENQITFNHGIGDFGFGAGAVTTTRAGKNGYIARLNMTTGKVDYVDAVWSDAANSNLTAIAINENNGKIIVAGQTYNTYGLEKVYIRKYVPSYSSIGPKRFHLQSTTFNGAIVNAIDYDEDSPLGSGTFGSFWLFGDFRSSFNISSYGGAPFTTLNASGAQRDAFVLKYLDHTGGPGAMTDNPNGVFLKKGNISYGASNSMTGMDIALDKTTGNAFMTGTKKGETAAAFGLAGHDLPIAFNRYTGYFVSMRFDGGIAPAGLSEISNPVGLGHSYSKCVSIFEDTVYFAGYRTTSVFFDNEDPGGSVLNFIGLASEDNLLSLNSYNISDGSYNLSNGTTNPSGIENAFHYPGAVAVDNFGHLFVTGSFQGYMGYMLGDPASGNLYYSSNGGSVFTMRVDIEVDEMPMQKPVFGDPIDNEAVENEGGAIDLVLIPNPTSGLTRIKLLNSDPLKIYTINVIGVDGRVIYYGEFNDSNLLLDCSTFANGIYTIWVNDEINAYSIKLIKAN